MKEFFGEVFFGYKFFLCAGSRKEMLAGSGVRELFPGTCKSAVATVDFEEGSLAQAIVLHEVLTIFAFLITHINYLLLRVMES